MGDSSEDIDELVGTEGLADEQVRAGAERPLPVLGVHRRAQGDDPGPIVRTVRADLGRDIEPKGFRLPVMQGFLTAEVIEEVRHLLEDAEYRNRTMDHNYAIASRYYSYSVLRRCLRDLLAGIRGSEGVMT